LHQIRTSALHPVTHGYSDNNNNRHSPALTEETTQYQTASQVVSRKTGNPNYTKTEFALDEASRESAQKKTQDQQVYKIF